jgi:hypothetical protein
MLVGVVLIGDIWTSDMMKLVRRLFASGMERGGREEGCGIVVVSMGSMLGEGSRRITGVVKASPHHGCVSISSSPSTSKGFISWGEAIGELGV